MHKLSIHHFGPVADATLLVSPFLVLIGPQASGKSTISKLIYYFLHVRDEIAAFIADTFEQETFDRRAAEWDLTKRLRNRFVEFWGPMPQPPDVCINYEYQQDYSLEITLDQTQHRYVTPRFSRAAWSQIWDVIDEVRGEREGPESRSTFLSAVGRLAAERQRSLLLQRIRERCNDIFRYDKELLFIPAGRSLLSTLADQMQYVHPHMLDYPMRQFVETVNTSNAYFNQSLDDIIRERQALSSTPVWFSAVRRAQSYVRRVLKGEYRHDREGGKLFITPDTFTKINYASSGQQEAVWILLSLFLLVLERSRALVVVEEPEAHLFPDAQNEVVRFVSFVHNALGCDFVLTTHSPYLLGCMNNLLYANQLAANQPSDKVKQVEQIVPRNLWLDPERVSGYFVHDGGIESLMVPELLALRIELIDTASDATNEEYLKLLALENAE